MSKPKVRFKGYTDAWEQRKLGDIGYAKSGVGFPDSEQGGTEGIPFYKVSDMNILGNENELVYANNYVSEEQIYRKKWKVIDDVPAIFFAKVGAAVMLNRKRLVRFPFLLDNNTMAYIFDKEIWNCDFGKTIFETIDLTQLAQTGALPSYNASDVEKIEIMIPDKAEQNKIGSYFATLDSLITLHQWKCEENKINRIIALEQRKQKKLKAIPYI
jgi:type I restriction enzyme S subunit